MPALAKARLQEISADPIPELMGEPFHVQFNPQSLKLELAARIEGGDTRSRQKRQYLGNASTTLSFDLHFDTADEGTTDQPVSVRTQTARVERFVLPKGTGSDKLATPRCRFIWDDLEIDGLIESVSIDFELFDASGTPLRAKMGVSIKEQNARYELQVSSRTANSATAPGHAGNGPGSTGGGPTDRSAPALGGESAAEFAARHGLDPRAWRGIAARLGGGSALSLSAGASIDFSASLASGAGIGVAAGVDVDAGIGLEATFGLDAGLATAGAGGGFALAAAGGVGPALAAVANARSDAAAGRARGAFGSAVPGAPGAVPPPAAASRPAPPAQPRTPARLGGAAAAAPSDALAGRPAAPAPAPPAADPRAASFGFGVPLRPRAAAAPPAPNARAAPAWLQEPAGASRREADRVQAQRLPRKPCCCK